MIRMSMRRPVAVAMVYAAVAVLGLQAWTNIPIELLPDTRLPRLTVRGTWRGASPETVEELDLVREAGVVREGTQERTITIVNRPGSAEDVRRAVISSAGGTPVLVSDIAAVHDTYEEARSFSRINGRPAVMFVVTKEIGANTVRAADAVKGRLAEVERLNPYGTRFILEDDESEEIREQLTDLRTRALFSVVVIFVVLLAFLRSFRSTALIFSSIGFSILIALNVIYFAGVTLNLLTLMGLAMGFGLIVDKAIVVLENVYRRWRGGESAGVAAEGGTWEVVPPVLASTMTTLIVFVPFVYLQGELRVFYVPLALVVALTLLASMVVSFTFIPSLASRVLRRRGSGAGQGGGCGEAPARPLYVRFYADVVGTTVRHPWLATFVTAVIFGGSYYLFDRYVTTWTIFGGGFGARTYISVFVELPLRARPRHRRGHRAEAVAAVPGPGGGHQRLVAPVHRGQGVGVRGDDRPRPAGPARHDGRGPREPPGRGGGRQRPPGLSEARRGGGAVPGQARGH